MVPARFPAIRVALLTAVAGLIILTLRSQAGAATAYVASYSLGTVTPINTSTNTPGTAITVGKNPITIAITPDGKTAYVVNDSFAVQPTVTPIQTATNKAGAAIKVPETPLQ